MAEGDISKKTGAELFKELLRIYPVAELEDYFKNGQWKDDMMKVDIELMGAHRREAGAPDPKPLSEVKMPPMPGAAGLAGPRPTLMAGVRPGLPGSVGLAMAAKPALGKAAPAAGLAGGASAEVRLIALFVAKWKLDMLQTKLALSKLPPARRRHVITTFKANPGSDATQQLLSFIVQCERSGNWGVAGAAPGLGMARATPTALGVKRPLTSPGMLDLSKRPRMMGTAAQQRPLTARPTALGKASAGPAPSLAARIAAARAQRPAMASIPRASIPQRAQIPLAGTGFRPGMARPMVTRPTMGLSKPLARPNLMVTRPGGLLGRRF